MNKQREEVLRSYGHVSTLVKRVETDRGMGRLLWKRVELSPDYGLSRRVIEMQFRFCRTGFIIYFLALLAVPIQGSPEEAALSATARAFNLPSGPLWASTAAWDADEQHLVVPDPGTARIYVYDLEGRLVRRIARPGRGPLEFENTHLIFRAGNRFLVGSTPYRFVWLDEKFESVAAFDLDWEKSESDHYRLAPYDVTASANAMYSIGTLQGFDWQWSDWGIYGVSLSGRPEVRQIGRISKDPKEHEFYREAPANLAVCGETPYLLRMGEPVAIQEIESSRVLKSFPAAFRKRPGLVPLSADSVELRSAMLSRSTAADGLYCVDETLLLLAHRPNEDQGVEWLVYPIDPQRDLLGSAIELPTSADDILFVPGDKRWAIFEKGKVERGNQPLTKLMTLPKPRFVMPEQKNSGKRR